MTTLAIDGAGAVYGLDWHPDGRTLASVWQDRRIHVWDVESRRVMSTLEGHRDIPSRLGFFPEGRGVVAWHPDGRILASGAGDGTILLWDLKPF